MPPATEAKWKAAGRESGSWRRPQNKVWREAEGCHSIPTSQPSKPQVGFDKPFLWGWGLQRGQPQKIPVQSETRNHWQYPHIEALSKIHDPLAPEEEMGHILPTSTVSARVQVQSGPAQSGPTLSGPAQSSPAQSGPVTIGPLNNWALKQSGP